MITVVSGLPRSGTSLMMQILEANGFEILTDNIRETDESNPKGYYEYEKVKSLMRDNFWLSEADGKAVKVIAQLIPYLPNNYEYKVIFMNRDMDEILSSQEKMLKRLESNKRISTDLLKKSFTSSVNKAKQFMELSKNITFAEVEFSSLFTEAGTQISEINKRLGFQLSSSICEQRIDQNLYREKRILK